MAARSIGLLILFLAGCAGTTGTTIHTLECRPQLEMRKVGDDTRLGWHHELWLTVDGASMPIATARGHLRPEPPVPLDPETVYTFTVERVETFSEVSFRLLEVSRP